MQEIKNNKAHMKINFSKLTLVQTPAVKNLHISSVVLNTTANDVIKKSYPGETFTGTALKKQSLYSTAPNC